MQQSIISALTAFSIASFGWFLLYRRSNQTSKRSETFSMLSNALTALNELEKTAEEHMKAMSHITDSKENLLHRQMFSTKVLAKSTFFRSKVDFLKQRSISLDIKKYLELKDALTMNDFSTINEYRILLRVTNNIRNELYSSFHQMYKPQ